MIINSCTFENSIFTAKNVGNITQIIGLVLTVTFSPCKIPNIYNSLIVKGQNTVG